MEGIQATAIPDGFIVEKGKSDSTNLQSQYYEMKRQFGLLLCETASLFLRWIEGDLWGIWKRVGVSDSRVGWKIGQKSSCPSWCIAPLKIATPIVQVDALDELNRTVHHLELEVHIIYVQVHSIQRDSLKSNLDRAVQKAERAQASETEVTIISAFSSLGSVLVGMARS